MYMHVVLCTGCTTYSCRPFEAEEAKGNDLQLISMHFMPVICEAMIEIPYLLLSIESLLLFSFACRNIVHF